MADATPARDLSKVAMEAIRLQNGYALAVDARDWDYFRTLFTPDVRAHYPHSSFDGVDDWLGNFIPLHDEYAWSLHVITNRFLTRASGGTGNHVGRPVRGRYVVSAPGHANGVQTRAAAKIDQSAARRERSVQPTPHLAAHILDQHVVAARTIVVSRDAVERLLGLAQLCQGVFRGHHENFN